MLKLTTDKHKASRGLSVTAELLVHTDSGQKACSTHSDRNNILLLNNNNSTETVFIYDAPIKLI